MTEQSMGPVYGNGGGDGVTPGWSLFWPKLEAWLATEE